MEEFKKNWEDKDLFGFLSEGVFSMKISQSKYVYITYTDYVIAKKEVVY